MLRLLSVCLLFAHIGFSVLVCFAFSAFAYAVFCRDADTRGASDISC